MTQVLPHILAVLNITAICLITISFYQIKQQNKIAHKNLMLMALLVSIIFMAIYLFYHSLVGNVKFTGQGIVRPIYFSILISHVILAGLIIPMILVTISFSIRKKFARHKRIAHWALPIWLYVSVTGVIVYVLAFHIYPT
ncbi:DUF420 domain-containing protein [Thiotrichales bacterium HSG1]|nr:DUF420 domain-containing protein [Thiotrichales bacterium HSG1]